jgi:hypothetical protein
MTMDHFDLYQETETGSMTSSHTDVLAKTGWVDGRKDIRPLKRENKPSAWTNACLWGVQAPYHPPVMFTNTSIVPVVVRITDPAVSKAK